MLCKYAPVTEIKRSIITVNILLKCIVILTAALKIYVTCAHQGHTQLLISY